MENYQRGPEDPSTSHQRYVPECEPVTPPPCPEVKIEVPLYQVPPRNPAQCVPNPNQNAYQQIPNAYSTAYQQAPTPNPPRIPHRPRYQMPPHPEPPRPPSVIAPVRRFYDKVVRPELAEFVRCKVNEGILIKNSLFYEMEEKVDLMFQVQIKVENVGLIEKQWQDLFTKTENLLFSHLQQPRQVRPLAPYIPYPTINIPQVIPLEQPIVFPQPGASRGRRGRVPKTDEIEWKVLKIEPGVPKFEPMPVIMEVNGAGEQEYIYILDDEDEAVNRPN